MSRLARRAIESINRSVKRQVKLIEDLLDASQISNGKLRLNLREIGITLVFQDILNDFKILAEAEQIEIEAVLAPNLGHLTADSRRDSNRY